MYLSNFQKEIVTAIEQKKIKSIDDFLLFFCDLEETENKGVTFSTSFGTYAREIKVFIPKDSSIAENHIKEFIAIWKKLENEELILSVKRKRLYDYTFPIFDKDVQYYSTYCKFAPNEHLLTIIQDIEYQEIVITSELSKFIEDNYVTRTELQQIEEKRDRIESQALTRRIAYISISISIIVSVVTMIINYLTYTTKREVIISNPNAFKDTITVKIIGEKDSLKAVKGLPKNFNK